MTKKQSTKKKEATKAKKEKLIYCGPNIGTKITKDTVFIGGIPKTIEQEIKECKEIKNLFVPIENYIEFKKKAREDGTVESLNYKAVQEYLKGKKRGEN